MQQRFECIILGGGLVGSACATALAQHGWSVALVDRSSLNSGKPSNSPLVSALNLHSLNFLKGLGVEAWLDPTSRAPFGHMRVHDNLGGGEINFDAQTINEQKLGEIVTNQSLQYALRQAFVNQGGALYAPCQAETVAKKIQSWQLSLSNELTLEAPLLLAADGGRSWLRGQVNIETTSWAYEQTAFVANLATEKPHDQIARQWFHPSGVLAFLPLAGPHEVSIVWSLNRSNANIIEHYTGQHFCERLQAMTAHSLGKLWLSSERLKKPLTMNHAKHYIQSGIALLGDAAHTIHPLAGQGVNIGFGDVMALKDVINDAKRKGRRYQAHDTLRRYERQRQTNAWLMIGLMEAFKRGFVNDSTILAGLRSRGLVFTDRCQLLKRFFVKQACYA